MKYTYVSHGSEIHSKRFIQFISKFLNEWN